MRGEMFHSVPSNFVRQQLIAFSMNSDALHIPRWRLLGLTEQRTHAEGVSA